MSMSSLPCILHPSTRLATIKIQITFTVNQQIKNKSVSDVMAKLEECTTLEVVDILKQVVREF